MMQERGASDVLSSRSFAQWFGALGPPLAWGAHLVLGDLIFELGCAPGVGPKILGLPLETWAIIETLRHTGIRVEELLELTHLAVVSYKLADTGEVIPLLQIVPSKSNEERLLLINPELASVLATGGNLVFVPDARGVLRAYDAETGKELWSHNNGVGHNGGIISYSAGGKQYIAVPAGWAPTNTRPCTANPTRACRRTPARSSCSR